MDVFDLGAWLGCSWCLSRVLLPTPSGRQRFNVFRAWHAIAARGHYGRQRYLHQQRGHFALCGLRPVGGQLLGMI